MAVPALGLFYAGLVFARVPLINIVGGVPLPPSVQPIATAYFLVMFFGFFPLVLGVLVWLVFLALAARDSTLQGFRFQQRDTAGRSLLILASIAILVFIAALPFTQRQQKLRYEAETYQKHNR